MRLIDADALLKTHCNECTLYPNDCLGDDCDSGAVIHIKEAPTIDAEPVIHGRWIKKRIMSIEWNCSEIYYTCSKCNRTIECDSPYCPYCGAKMDGAERREDD